MKAGPAKVVRIAFAEALLNLEPRFAQDEGAEVPPGCAQYKTTVDGLSAFLVLLIHPKTDSFGVDVGWSLDGRYPAYAIPGRPEQTGGDKLRFSIRRLWIKDRVDHGWVLRSDRSEDQARAAVADAIGHIRSDVVPYLKHVAQLKVM